MIRLDYIIKLGRLYDKYLRTGKGIEAYDKLEKEYEDKFGIKCECCNNVAI